MDEDDFIHFLRKLDIYPSQEEINLFYRRFGKNGTKRVSIEKME